MNKKKWDGVKIANFLFVSIIASPIQLMILSAKLLPPTEVVSFFYHTYILMGDSTFLAWNIYNELKVRIPHLFPHLILI